MVVESLSLSKKIPSYVNLRLSLHLALEKTSDSILMIEKKKKKQNTSSRLWAFNHNEGWILPPKRKKKKKNKKLITGASWNLSLLTKSFVTDHSRPTDGQFLFQMTRVITGLLLLVVFLL